jgi:DNA-binding MarR family transcriptional regulator/GNAT superfamily N-acetyltransferase
MEARIAQVGSFNRIVTQRLGVLSEQYLGRDRPLAETRLLFEIGTRGAPVQQLRGRLGLDSGFVSRLLRSLERKGLVTTARQTGGDARVRVARLTRAGTAELRRINALSDTLAQSMLTPLSQKQAQRLVSAMTEVDRLLRASSVEFELADPASPAAQHCLDAYFAEISARFRGGFDRDTGGAAAIQEFVAPTGGLVIARLFTEPVGCGAVRTLEPGVGEIKRMWVAGEVRGLGVGRQLLRELEQVARKYKMRALRLDTNEALTEAINLYRSCGFQEIARFNANPYAHHWFEKRLR